MAHKEPETIEFKKSAAELKEAVVAIAAMFNMNDRAYVRVGESGKARI
ncbi:MAG: hypothetical protein V1670_02460 [Candidatus Omnitrophota bacterium]